MAGVASACVLHLADDLLSSDRQLGDMKKAFNHFDWSGAAVLGRVCAVYELYDSRVPHGGNFKVKVVERADDFAAFVNVLAKDAEGMPDYLSGIGRSEREAIEDLMRRFMKSLETSSPQTEDDFEWSDPHDF